MALAKRLTAFTAAFLVVAAIAAGFALVLTKRATLFEVSSILVEVEQAPEDPRAATRLRERVTERLRSYVGLKIWEIDLGAMNASIAADEWVRGARISRAFPNRVQVTVAPKNPELLLVGDDGRLRPIADDGSLLNAMAPGLLPDVPIVRGPGLLESAELRSRAVAFARELPERGPLSIKNIAEIVYSPGEGYSLVLASPRAEVRVGDERVALKLARATQVIEYMNANKLKGRVIDASFSKKVLVRLRKGP